MKEARLYERDICTKHILPALESAGWDPMLQLREEFEIDKLVSHGQPGAPITEDPQPLMRPFRKFPHNG